MRKFIVLAALSACAGPDDLTATPSSPAPSPGTATPQPLDASLGTSGDAQVGDDMSGLAVQDTDELGNVRTYAADRILVGTHGPAPESLVVQGRKLVRLAAFELIDGGVYELPEGVTPVAAVNAVNASGLVRYAELDHVRTAAAVNDPMRGYQWGLDEVNADAAWLKSTGTGAVVAVIDTGVSASPNDGLTSLLAGWDYVNNDSNPADDNGHGTHVASTIGERTNNSKGCAGLAYNASILPVKVLGADGNGFTSNVILGVQYATQRGADVVNLSLGSTTFSQSESDAMTAARNAGLVIIAATGNQGATSIHYPAGYAAVVAVGATGFGGVIAPYSNRGTGIDVVAPGGNFQVDANGDGYTDGILQETYYNAQWNYWFFEGTSMATPHVAAIAALLASLGATNTEIESTLTSTAVDLGTAGYDTTFGAGLVQADDAVNAWIAAHPVNAAPVARTNGPYTATTNTAVSLSGATSSDSDGTVVSYAWTFGDGTTGTGATVSKAWATAGTYTVTLKVTDDDGATSTATTTATVSAPSTCQFSGTISSGSLYHTVGTASTGTLISRKLTWPTTTANLDFYLEAAAAGSTRWSSVASSVKTGASPESIAYTVTSKQNGYQFRWRVTRKSGSTTYCIAP